MIIHSYRGEYQVNFCADFSFLKELATRKNLFVIIDRKVFQLYGETLSVLTEKSSYYLMDAAEENKTVEKALEIIDMMIDMPSRKNTLLIAVGGGIVQDVAAFTANILYRGISWILIPTTLLAQADSCIGSKSSLNFRHYKNILGYFFPPAQIYIHTKFVFTLEWKDYLSGLGEIMKCSIMDGYDCFQEIKQSIPEMLDRNEEVLMKNICKALEFKKKVIEQDEFDNGYRNIMNFGHTFGHALEAVSDYAVPHGQGVSVGMMIANQISYQRGYITKEMCNEINMTIQKIILPEHINKNYFERDRYLDALKKDKKYDGKKHVCILYDGNGVKKYSDIEDDEIMKAVVEIFDTQNTAVKE